MPSFCLPHSPQRAPLVITNTGVASKATIREEDLWVTELQVAPNFRRHVPGTDSCLPSQFFCVKMVIYFTLVCPAGVLLSLCSPGQSCWTHSQCAVNECTAAPGLHRWGTTGMTAHITNIISRLPQNQCPPPEAVRWAQRA